MEKWHYLYGLPNITADLRTSPEDFKVFEMLPFEPSGDGEHLFVKIRKKGVNTGFVAKELANFFNIKDTLVSYAGLKDRFAVTEQWFGVHLPGKTIDNLDGFNLEGVDVITTTRHHKKLRIGALSGNTFQIVLRNVSDLEALKQRWLAISRFGVPNYFGEQRFGIDGGNVAKAREMFAGAKVKNKKMRGIYLSAARSFIFNQIVANRIENKIFDVIKIGDALMLSGTNSVFKVDKVTEELSARLIEGDVDLTAAMWGKGELFTFADVADDEAQVAEMCDGLRQGLEEFGLKQERRRIRLLPQMCGIDTDEKQQLAKLTFTLESGCFATAVLRELVCYQDLTVRQGSGKA